MKRTLCALVALMILTGCTRSTAAPRKARQTTTDVQTIDNADPRPAVLDPPPVLTDEGPAPKPKVDITAEDAPPPPNAQDEALRSSIPFAPAISLDPVNGTKISIRANTVMHEYKGHLFYFSGQDSKRTFIANPEQFTKGVFAF